MRPESASEDVLSTVYDRKKYDSHVSLICQGSRVEWVRRKSRTDVSFALRRAT